MESIGKQIRKRRRDLEMSQQTLADSVGVTRGHIQAIEVSKSNPSIEVLTKIATVLELTFVIGKDKNE